MKNAKRQPCTDSIAGLWAFKIVQTHKLAISAFGLHKTHWHETQSQS